MVVDGDRQTIVDRRGRVVVGDERLLLGEILRLLVGRLIIGLRLEKLLRLRLRLWLRVHWNGLRLRLIDRLLGRVIGLLLLLLGVANHRLGVANLLRGVGLLRDVLRLLVLRLGLHVLLLRLLILLLLLLREREVSRGVGVSSVGLVVGRVVVGSGGAIAGVAGHELTVGGDVVGQSVANACHWPEVVVALGWLRVDVAGGVCWAIHDARLLLVVLAVEVDVVGGNSLARNAGFGQARIVSGTGFEDNLGVFRLIVLRLSPVFHFPVILVDFIDGFFHIVDDLFHVQNGFLHVMQNVVRVIEFGHDELVLPLVPISGAIRSDAVEAAAVVVALLLFGGQPDFVVFQKAVVGALVLAHLVVAVHQRLLPGVLGDAGTAGAGGCCGGGGDGCLVRLVQGTKADVTAGARDHEQNRGHEQRLQLKE